MQKAETRVPEEGSPETPELSRKVFARKHRLKRRMTGSDSAASAVAVAA